MINKLSERFDELYDEMGQIAVTQRIVDGAWGQAIKVDDELLLTWTVKVKNLLVNACGEKSQHYQELIKAEEITGLDTNYDAFKRMRAVFTASREG